MVYSKPVANFNINRASQCLAGNAFAFTDVSTISDGSITRSWNLADGSLIGGTNVIKSYTFVGTYVIRLYATSDFGCNDSISKSVTVNPSPSASFTTNDDIQCLNGNSFTYTNTTTGAPVFNSSWKIGDATTVTTTNASRTYSAPGTYRVSLNVNTAFGCQDSAYYLMRVLPNPGNLTITGPISAALGSVHKYSVVATPGSAYNWVVTNGTILSNGGAIIQVKWNSTGATGILQVTETAENGCAGNPATVNVGLVAGMNAIAKNAFAANLYPNPGKDNFTVEVSTGDMVTMNVYDQTGRLVMGDIRFNNSVTINDHHLASGIYTARIYTDKGKTTILRFEVSN